MPSRSVLPITMPIALSFGQHSRSWRFFARGISQYQRDSFLPFALRFVEDPRTGSSLQKKSNEDRFDAVTEHRLVSFDIQDVAAATLRWRSLGPRSLREERAWELGTMSFSSTQPTAIATSTQPSTSSNRCWLIMPESPLWRNRP